MMDPRSSDAAHLADAFSRFGRALGSRRREFVVVFLTVALLVEMAAFFWPATFEARAALLIQRARSGAPIDADPKEPTTVVSAGVTEQEVNSEIAILTSQEVRAATVASTGLDKIEPSWYLRILLAPLRGYDRVYAWYHHVPTATPTDRAIRGIGLSITAERLKDSNVVAVTLASGNPRLAEAVLGKLLEHYLARHVEINRTAESQSFFLQQADVLSGELARNEDDLLSMEKSLGVADVTLAKEVQQRTDASLREEALSTDRRLVEVSGLIAAHRRTLEGASRPGQAEPSDPAAESLRSQALKYELEQLRLEARFRDDFPLVKENRENLGATRQALEAEERKNALRRPTLLAADEALARLEAERAGLLERKRLLDEQRRHSGERLVQLAGKSVERERRSRLIRSAEERYLMYLARGEKERIDSALDQLRLTNVTIVQQAVAEPRPVSPKKLTVLLVALGGGLLAGLLTCLWLEARKQGLFSVLASAAPPA